MTLPWDYNHITTRVCVDWVRFPMLCSRCDTEFRQHLPVVLMIHVLAISREDVYPENNRGGTDEIPHQIWSTAYGKTNPIYKIGRASCRERV